MEKIKFFIQQEERDLIEHCRLLSVRYSIMYIINNGIFLDSWNKTVKLLDILLIDSCPECLHTSFLHDIVRISFNQEPKMKVNLQNFLIKKYFFFIL